MKLSIEQKFILNYLKDKEWVGPTQLGLVYGKTYTSASAWATPKCKSLVSQGLLEKSLRGLYQIMKSQPIDVDRR